MATRESLNMVTHRRASCEPRDASDGTPRACCGTAINPWAWARAWGPPANQRTATDPNCRLWLCHRLFTATDGAREAQRASSSYVEARAFTTGGAQRPNLQRASSKPLLEGLRSRPGGAPFLSAIPARHNARASMESCPSVCVGVGICITTSDVKRQTTMAESSALIS